MSSSASVLRRRARWLRGTRGRRRRATRSSIGPWQPPAEWHGPDRRPSGRWSIRPDHRAAGPEGGRDPLGEGGCRRRGRPAGKAQRARRRPPAGPLSCRAGPAPGSRLRGRRGCGSAKRCRPCTRCIPTPPSAARRLPPPRGRGPSEAADPLRSLRAPRPRRYALQRSFLRVRQQESG